MRVADFAVPGWLQRQALTKEQPKVGWRQLLPGFHSGPIVSAGVATKQLLLVTASHDMTVRTMQGLPDCRRPPPAWPALSTQHQSLHKGENAVVAAALCCRCVCSHLTQYFASLRCSFFALPRGILQATPCHRHRHRRRQVRLWCMSPLRCVACMSTDRRPLAVAIDPWGREVVVAYAESVVWYDVVEGALSPNGCAPWALPPANPHSQPRLHPPAAAGCAAHGTVRCPFSWQAPLATSMPGTTGGRWRKRKAFRLLLHPTAVPACQCHEAALVSLSLKPNPQLPP